MKETRAQQEQFSSPPHVTVLLAPIPRKKVLLGISSVCRDLDRGRLKLEITLLTFYPYSS